MAVLGLRTKVLSSILLFCLKSFKMLFTRCEDSVFFWVDVCLWPNPFPYLKVLTSEVEWVGMYEEVYWLISVASEPVRVLCICAFSKSFSLTLTFIFEASLLLFRGSFATRCFAKITPYFVILRTGKPFNYSAAWVKANVAFYFCLLPSLDLLLQLVAAAPCSLSCGETTLKPSLFNSPGKPEPIKLLMFLVGLSTTYY